MVPTFTLAAFHRLGAQLCPSGFAMVTPQAFTMASLSAISTESRVLPAKAGMRTATQPISARLELVGLS